MFSLDDIFGQDAAISWLRQAYLADRLPHAMIFSGPVGVGKGATAAALAKLFLCEKPKKDRPCGTCDSCRTFDGGNHPDFHVVTKELIRVHDKSGTSTAAEFRIEVIRQEVVAKAGRTAVMRRGKVFIIEQAELMNTYAQNAMLKTLEEPDGRTMIVLLTDQPDVLLATIRSRCQTVRFAGLDEDRVREELVRRGVDAAIAADAAALSRGSLGVALKWVEDGVIAPAGQLIAMIDRLFAGHPPNDLAGWFKSAAEAYAAKQLERDELSSKNQGTRDGLTLYLVLAGEHIRRKLADDAGEAELETACTAIDALAQAESYLDANVSIPLIFQQLAVKLERVG